MFLERDRTISGGDMNTSDLSGNESTDGSGMKFMIIFQMLNIFCFILESPTQVGDDYSFDEPFIMRSSESK